MSLPLITILGPTACGKTALACRLAFQLDAEIISADSRQVYRNMDIGTGKDISEYTLEGKNIPYHLIDIVDAGERYNVFEFQQDFHRVYTDISTRNKPVILCGGSGLYIEAVLKGYAFQKPVQAIPSIIFGLQGDRDLVRERITLRLKERLENGLIEEVEALLQQGLTPERLIRYGLEYKFLTLYIQKELSREELFRQLNIAIHQFSKRQMTWFRKMEREGFKIHWLDIEWGMEEKLGYIERGISEQ